MTGEGAAIRLLQGNEACALGAIAAGCRFYAGYPITPSSEIAEWMARLLPAAGGTFIQMEDEIASMAAIIGASLGGARSMTATSGPGFSLMQENLGFGVFTEIPCVVVNVMRGGPSTGLPTSPAQGDVLQARWGTHGDHEIIALAPASVAEAYTETARAFALAERYRTPVVVLLDEVVGHMREAFSPDADIALEPRRRPTAPRETYRPFGGDDGDVPALAAFGDGYRFHVTGLAHDERGQPTRDPGTVARLHTRLRRKIEAGRPDIVRCETWGLDDATLAVVAYGATARSARAAVKCARERGLQAALIRPLTLWPFPVDVIRACAPRLAAIVVAEMNLGQIALEVERAVTGTTRVVGCHQANGELIPPERIVEAMTRARA
jgi:2-oxoglutarate ferredoxin oxidoreductase subunit alpha